MTLTHNNPESLHINPAFSHLVEIDALALVPAE